MPIDETNRAQADFWAASGAQWTRMRDRFDAQAGAHGTAAIDALGPATGEYVIDIGCGAGSTTLELSRRVGRDGRVLGLDISPTMLEGARAFAAQAGATNITFAEGDAMIEPFAGDADAVYSRFGVMFFADALAGFANLRTALRPDGRLGFVCWQAPIENPWITRPLAAAANYVEMPFGSDPTAPGPMSLADPARVRSLLAEAGFVDIDVQPRSAPTTLGTDLDDAIDFLFGLMAPIGALQRDDPEKAAALRHDLETELADWAGPEGVTSPSATWVVTARRPV
jgi:SAM-dependent methyltransferase